jgi:hypothetical protein
MGDVTAGSQDNLALQRSEKWTPRTISVDAETGAETGDYFPTWHPWHNSDQLSQSGGSTVGSAGGLRLWPAIGPRSLILAAAGDVFCSP